MTHSATVPSREDVYDLLQAGDLAGLETRFQGLHRAHACGEISEQQLEQAYDAAGNYRKDLTLPLQRWAAEYPRSYPAQVSLGLHFFARYVKLRTMRLAADIPEKNLNAMRKAVHNAHSQLQQSLGLDPLATLAFITLIYIETQQGDRAWEIYHQGVQRNPNSVLLRLAMLSNLRTEWGGSEAEMQEFLDRPEHEHLTVEERKQLEAGFYRNLGHWRAKFARDRRGAEEAYQQSIALHPTAMALSGLGDLRGVLMGRKYQDQAVALAPNDLYIQAARAAGRLRSWAPARTHLATLRHCAEWGDPYAYDLATNLSLGQLRLAGLLAFFFDH